MNPLPLWNVFGCHDDDSVQMGQLRTAILNPCEHRFVLDENKTGIRMGEDINQLWI